MDDQFLQGDHVVRSEDWVKAHSQYAWQRDIFAGYKFEVLESQEDKLKVRVLATPEGYSKFLKQEFWNPKVTFSPVLQVDRPQPKSFEVEVDAERFDIDL